MRSKMCTALCLAATGLVSAQQSVFRSAAEAVTIPVSVTDRNRPVANLTAVDFELFDNGVKQDIALTAIAELPTDVTFLIDVSGSVDGRALERIKRDVQEMASLALPNDRIRLVSFARDAVDVFGQLPGGASLDFSRLQAGGITALYDALVTVLAASPAAARPHMIFVVTDGRDNASFMSVDSVVAVAQRSGAVLCLLLVQSSNPLVREGGSVDVIDPMAGESSVTNVTTGAATRMIPGVNLPTTLAAATETISISRHAGPYKGGPNLDRLRDAAETTGGVLSSDTSKTPIPELFRRLLDDFRSSYILFYTPTGVDRRGLHDVVVKVRNSSYIVRARRSYEQR